MSRDASLHEKTVQAAAEFKPELQRAATTRLNSRMITTRMDLRVWKLALKLASGDSQRIQIIAPDEVIVHNNKAWRSRG